MSAIAANNPSAAATYWSFWYCLIIALVWYSTTNPAKIIIAPENHSPSCIPKIIAQTIIPSATKEAIVRNEPRNEKSFFEKKAYALIPAVRAAVIMPACGIVSGANILANIKSGRKIMDSAIMYRAKPAYCFPRVAPLTAQEFASEQHNQPVASRHHFLGEFDGGLPCKQKRFKGNESDESERQIHIYFSYKFPPL